MNGLIHLELMNKYKIINEDYYKSIVYNPEHRAQVLLNLGTTTPWQNMFCVNYSDEGFCMFDIQDVLDDGTYVLEFTGTAS